MIRLAYYFFLTACWLCSGFTFLSASAADFDFNRDGMVRFALLSTPEQNGGIDAAVICSDLENMIKASKPGMPVRVTHEAITLNRTVMGWWYHPETQTSRSLLFAGQYDLLLIAENDEIVRGYPEFFFEGVRVINQEAKAHGIRTALVLMSKPGNTFRDARLPGVADQVYRVGDGCGVEVIPSAFGWYEALARNRMTGNSPVRARACAYLTAAGIYCKLSGYRVPKGALEAYWTTKKTTEVLALSAYEAIEKARVQQHYKGPFSGVVRIEPRITKRLKVFVPNTADEDPIRLNLQFILDAAFQDWFWKTPSDWYQDGFDRYSSAFDLVYGDIQQINQYLDPMLYTSASHPPTNQTRTCKAVFCRNPAGDATGLDTLRNLEPLLFEGYDYAKSKGLVFIPYQLAWARVQQTDSHLVKKTSSGRNNDWLSYMMANMIYTLVTDRYQPPSEKTKPHYANEIHPRGAHDVCARIGYETVMQLATLTESLNTVLLRSETYRISQDNPGFVGIRLLNRPTKEVSVFCATDIGGVAALSRESMIFTPDNYDIEQTVRVLPATNAPTLFFHFMASVQSEDKAIDGANDLRPFILNFDEKRVGSFTFSGEHVSPNAGLEAKLQPLLRPCDVVKASIMQHGRMTEEVYFSPDHYDGTMVRLHPTADDYAKGVLQVTVQTSSSDGRYDLKQFTFSFRVASNGTPLPYVAVTAPEAGKVIAGPAFVMARAESDVTNGVQAVSIYLGHKRLGRSSTPVCSVAVESGPPQTRLGRGTYTLWAEATVTNGLSVASEPVTFYVHDLLDATAVPSN